MINAVDCGTHAGLWIRAEDNAFDPNLPQLGERILGRVLAGPVIDPGTGDVLYDRGHLLNEHDVERIEAAIEALDGPFWGTWDGTSGYGQEGGNG